MTEERTRFQDLSDDEKHERIESMRNNANSAREKYGKGKYFSFGEAIDEIKQADGAGETAVASVKLIGKSLFNIGRFTVAEVIPGMMEQTAKQAEKSMK